MTVNEQELHAFIDGELEPERATEIGRLIAGDTALAARVAAFRSDKERLSRIYAGLEKRPLPAEWLRQIETRDRSVKPLSRLYTMRSTLAGIAAALLVALGTWTAFEVQTAGNPDAIIGEAISARADSLKPQEVIEVAAASPSEDQNEVLTSALGMKLKVPDMSKVGYRLAVIRVYSDVPGGKAVELRYRSGEDRVFTLYVRHPNSAARVDLLQRDNLRICIWQDDVVGTVMVGQMSAGEMARAASAAYAGLNL